MAFAASDALIIINMCGEIIDLYGAVFAYLYALHTADTSLCTLFSRNNALVVVLTEDCGFSLMQGKKFYNLLGAGIYAFFTCAACDRINARDTVAYMNGVERTYLYAVAETETAEDTLFLAAVELLCHAAGVYADIIHLLDCGVVIALTENDSRHGLDFARFKSHYLRNLLGNGGSAGIAERGIRGLALGERRRVTRTSRISARTAVSAGETFGDLLRLFILGDCHYDREHGEQESRDKSDSAYGKNS